jgi:hypothetical protein
MQVGIDGMVYCCATCHWWSAEDGCTISESPSTVNCGRTGPDDLCEQWAERETPEQIAARIGARKEALYELARRDRQMSETLYRHDNRFHGVNDPIEAEVYCIRCELYCALADGADAEVVFQSHYDRAKAACEQFNVRQEAAMRRRSWHETDTGYFSPDEAWQRLRHAIRTYDQITGM